MITIYFQLGLCFIAVFVQNTECAPYLNPNGQLTPGDQTGACVPSSIIQKIRQVKAIMMALLQKKFGELRIICSTLTTLCDQTGVGAGLSGLTPEQLSQLVGADYGLNLPPPADNTPLAFTPPYTPGQ